MAIRAISTEFGQRIYVPIVLITAGVAVVLIGLLIWLVTLSGWWWFLLAPIILLTIMFIFVAVIAGFLIKFLQPVQTKDQRKSVKRFVDLLQESSDAIQTPKFIILFRLVKDTIAPNDRGYVRELAGKATSLKYEFQSIVTLFS